MTPTTAAGPHRGAALRQARRARVRMIRRRVVAAALALFVATWILITLVLATGHDPALARQAAARSTASTTARRAPAATATSTATSPAVTTSTSAGSAAGSSTSAGGSSSATAGPVTSSQS